MSPRPSLGRLGGGGGGNLKEKITIAIRRVESQRKELDLLRSRLEERRRSMFTQAIRAIETGDEMRSRVLSGEHAELQKVARVVGTAELALMHIVVRMETIRDVGDVMFVLDNAFRAVKTIGKSISEIAPNLERSAQEINDSLSNILAELGVFTPSISIELSDTPSEIYEKAQKLIDERTSEISELPNTIQRAPPENLSTFERTRRIALLATAEDNDEGLEDEGEFRPMLLAAAPDAVANCEDRIREYMSASGGQGQLRVEDASAQLNLPVDLVEQACIKVLSESRFNAKSREQVLQPHEAEETPQRRS